jgi:hypothetical protein
LNAGASPLSPLSEYVEGKEEKRMKIKTANKIILCLAPLFVLGEGLGVRPPLHIPMDDLATLGSTRRVE